VWSEPFDISGWTYTIEIDADGDFSPADTTVTDITPDESHTEIGLGQGDHHWRVRVVDNLGNLGDWSASRYVTVDTIPASLDDEDFDPEIVGTSAIVNVDLTVTDANGVASVELVLYDSGDVEEDRVALEDQGDTHWTLPYDISGEDDGSYSIDAVIVDQAGNSITYEDIGSVTLDTAGPGITLM